MYSVHISDVRTFRTCRRRWNWSSRLRENLESIVPYPPFFTGKAVHAALELYYRDKENFESTLQKYFKQEEANLAKLGKLWPAEVEKLVAQIALIEGVMEHYVLWQAQDETYYADKNLEYHGMEIDFTVPFMPDANFEGRLDGLVKHIPTGEYWIWETKTAGSITSLVESLPNDEQSTMYLWAARQIYDFPIKGVLYNILRKKSPSAPRLLTSGLLSKAQNVDTTSFFYREVIKEIHPDWSDETIEEMYGDILQNHRERDMTFFMRFPVYRTEDEINMVVDNIKATAVEMINPDTVVYPCPSMFTCKGCTFRSACLTMNSLGNYRALLESEYQLRQSHTSMREEENDD